VRWPNIIFDHGGDLKLIEFDWCGPAGEARYPSDIWLERGKFHPNVQKGGKMQMEHDEYLSEQITGQELNLET
jgi:hypothetical protein